MQERVAEHRSREGVEIFREPDFKKGDFIASSWMMKDWKMFSAERLLKAGDIQYVEDVLPGWGCWKVNIRKFSGNSNFGELRTHIPAEGYVKVTEVLEKYKSLVIARKYGI